MKYCVSFICLALFGFFTSDTRSQPCEWSDAFSLAGINGDVADAVVWDDGDGPALYIGGRFSIAGRAVASCVARWDAGGWAALGHGVDDYVHALAVFNDGSGEALYVGGTFDWAGGQPAPGIAKWDGSSWSSVGSGVEEGGVGALAVFDDGAGAALYAGGVFSEIGGVQANNIARWDGAKWSPLGAGVTGPGRRVNALQVFEDGSGPVLYVGGQFDTAGQQNAENVARWDGNAWAPLGSGVSNGTFPEVRAFAVFDDGSGSALYVGGGFLLAGGLPVNGVAKWTASTWSPVGGGVSGINHADIRSLTTFDDGAGPALFASGRFLTAGGGSANYFARWDGAAWTPLGSGLDAAASAMVSFDDGAGRALYLVGWFDTAGGKVANGFARWDGVGFSVLGSGSGVNGGINDAIVFDDGAGPALYVAGNFSTAGGTPAENVARWDGRSWAPLGDGVTPSANALEVYDDGTGPALFAAGPFWSAGGQPAAGIAKWDGQSWHPLDPGLTGVVDALAVYDGLLWAAGGLTSPSGGAAGVARWNGSSWSFGLSDHAYALAVFDDGSGPALYVGGRFIPPVTRPGPRYIAKWNGHEWSSVGSIDSHVHALANADDGEGLDLYAGGSFDSAGGQSARHIARWDGSEWSALGTGVDRPVSAIAGFNDGTGPAVYVGGHFDTAGGQPANSIARWNGTTWSTLGPGLLSVHGSYTVNAIVGFDDGNGPALYAVGRFGSSGMTASANIGRWSCTCYPDCDPSTGKGVLDIFDFLCFQDAFVKAEPYACDCDTTGGPGACDILDFLCFQDAFVAGCQ